MNPILYHSLIWILSCILSGLLLSIHKHRDQIPTLIKNLGQGTWDRWYRWHLETLAVAAFLIGIAILAPALDRGFTWALRWGLPAYFGVHVPSEWIGVCALVLAHGRNSVMFRFIEASKQDQDQVIGNLRATFLKMQPRINGIYSNTKKWSAKDYLDIDISNMIENTIAVIEDKKKHQVHCWRWADIYFYGAEAFWLYYFVDHRAPVALAGVFVFVGYGRYRGWYMNRIKNKQNNPA